MVANTRNRSGRARAGKSLLLQDSSAEDLYVSRSQGSLLFDERGRRYIDFTMGWCVGNLGWGRREIAEAIRSFDGPDYVSPTLKYRPWEELARMLSEIAPGKLRGGTCVRATGGTEAVDIALQIALLATGRKKFVSIEGSYHGNSIGTMSVASSANREQFGNLLSNCKKIKPPLDERAISKVETALRGKDVAAFIMEPVIMNLGVMTPALGFMDELRRLCTRTGTALIFDEVACGFGRTGTMFATEHFDIEPDIMCLAKAITGGYAGLGAVIMSQSIAGEVEGEFAPWSTYGWHPLSVAAAIADVRYIIKHQLKLLRHVNEMGEYLRERLEQMAFQHEPVFRVKGLAIGVEFEQEGYADEIQERCFKEGLLVSGDDDVLMLLPALTVERATAEAGLDILERCV